MADETPQGEQPTTPAPPVEPPPAPAVAPPVETHTQGAAASGKTPIHKKWWFWAIGGQR